MAEDSLAAESSMDSTARSVGENEDSMPCSEQSQEATNDTTQSSGQSSQLATGGPQRPAVPPHFPPVGAPSPGVTGHPQHMNYPYQQQPGMPPNYVPRPQYPGQGYPGQNMGPMGQPHMSQMSQAQIGQMPQRFYPVPGQKFVSVPAAGVRPPMGMVMGGSGGGGAGGAAASPQAMFQRYAYYNRPSGSKRSHRKSVPSASASLTNASASGSMHTGGSGQGGPAQGNQQQQQQQQQKKRRKLAERLLTERVKELVPESQAYMDLLQFEKKLDETIMRKRLEIQEALKRPAKQKKKLRIYISNNVTPPITTSESPEERMGTWELRVEGRLLQDSSGRMVEPAKSKRKFSSFFKSLVIELDKDLYGPDNHLVEWQRTAETQETDGFQVKRPGSTNVKCTMLFMLDYQPAQFKLEQHLSRLLGIHTQTRPAIITALWQYIKTHKLQDPHEREYINCDKYLSKLFEREKIRFTEVPQLLTGLLLPPDPIVINHLISVEDVEAAKKTACYDIEVEVEDDIVPAMQQFILSLQNQQDIVQNENKIHDTVDIINQCKIARDFYLSFALQPQDFIQKWIFSQSNDLKTVTDTEGNPDEERRLSYLLTNNPQEATNRYFSQKLAQRKTELEKALGV